MLIWTFSTVSVVVYRLRGQTQIQDVVCCDKRKVEQFKGYYQLKTHLIIKGPLNGNRFTNLWWGKRDVNSVFPAEPEKTWIV